MNRKLCALLGLEHIFLYARYEWSVEGGAIKRVNKRQYCFGSAKN